VTLHTGCTGQYNTILSWHLLRRSFFSFGVDSDVYILHVPEEPKFHSEIFSMGVNISIFKRKRRLGGGKAGYPTKQ
jgi:hypothetical protein